MLFYAWLGALQTSSASLLQTSALSYLSFGAAWLDEDGKVSDLVRDLVQQDGECGDSAHCWTNQERRTDRQPVGEIMGEVSCQVQVTGHLDVCASWENTEHLFDFLLQI